MNRRLLVPVFLGLVALVAALSAPPGGAATTTDPFNPRGGIMLTAPNFGYAVQTVSAETYAAGPHLPDLILKTAVPCLDIPGGDFCGTPTPSYFVPGIVPTTPSSRITVVPPQGFAPQMFAPGAGTPSASAASGASSAASGASPSPTVASAPAVATPAGTAAGGTMAANTSMGDAATASGAGTAMPATTASACIPLAPNSAFAVASFQTQWQGGEALAANLWGPTVTGGLMEPYAGGANGARLVQYFDKGRMELADATSGTVTNGLLANELITGQIQLGDGTYGSKPPPAIPIAGDADNPGPTYAAFGGTASALLAPTPSQMGALVTTTVAADGTITPGMGGPGSGPTALSAYDAATQHNLPQAFADYRARIGLGVIGLAKSEPFLTTVKVGGQPKQVLVQVFERRVLTYTADNPDPFKVEMANIGQHYYRWRYCT